MLTRFVYIIHSITSSQPENDRYLSLAGIYTALRGANISVEIIYDFLFIRINSAALERNNTIDVFGGSLIAVADIIDEMESNPYNFVYASDTE